MADARDDLYVLALAGEEVLVGCDRVDDNQWTDPTPCSEWCVGDLVDHVVGGNVFTVNVLAGRDADAAMAATMASFDDSYDRRSALSATLAEQYEAFARPGALHGVYQHVAGELSGHQLVRARVHDLIIHGWDLAQALDPPAGIPPMLVRWAIEELRSADSMTAAAFGIDATNINDHASLVVGFGRDR